MEHCGSRTIETERLILRKLCPEDADAMFRNWASDPEVTRFLTWPTHSSVEVTKELLSMWEKEYEKENFYQWGIELKEIGEVVGTISVVRLEEKIDEAELGYCMGRSWWHRGIMTEALTAVISFLFESVKCNRIVARHDVMNPNSGAVMKKCGMQFEGVSRSAGINNQGICDMGQYAILRSDL